jgi:hypothetical protein
VADHRAALAGRIRVAAREQASRREEGEGEAYEKSPEIN